MELSEEDWYNSKSRQELADNLRRSYLKAQGFRGMVRAWDRIGQNTRDDWLAVADEAYRWLIG